MGTRLVAALAVVVALVAPGAADAAWPPREPLGVAGRWLVDADGRVVIARGMNLVDKRPPYVPGARGFDAADARFLRRAGFGAIRLGWIHKGLEPVRGAYDLGYLERFAADVRVAREAGLLVLVDLHQDYFNERTGGEGFPDWMTPLPGVPPRRDALAFDLFWASAGWQERVAAAWGVVAARLAREPGVLGYDLLNEPFPGVRESECAQLGGCRAFDRGVLDPFYARVAAAVRAADPARVVWVEPHVVFNSGAASWVSAPGEHDPAGFSFHVYCRENASGVPCSTRRPRAFDNAEDIARRTGMALLLSEFGATDSAGELAVMVREADERMLGWLHWALWNHDPFAARPHEGVLRDLDRPPAGANVKEDKLALLARPHPRAVAGTPLGWRWAPDARELEVRWAVRGAAGAPLAPGAETEIVLPPTAFPAGWQATVAGGRAAGGADGADGAGRLGESAAQADVLRIVAAPDATEVVVRVRPGRPAKRKRRASGRRAPSPPRRRSS